VHVGKKHLLWAVDALQDERRGGTGWGAQTSREGTEGAEGTVGGAGEGKCGEHGQAPEALGLASPRQGWLAVSAVHSH